MLYGGILEELTDYFAVLQQFLINISIKPCYKTIYNDGSVTFFCKVLR